MLNCAERVWMNRRTATSAFQKCCPSTETPSRLCTRLRRSAWQWPARMSLIRTRIERGCERKKLACSVRSRKFVRDRKCANDGGVKPRTGHTALTKMTVMQVADKELSSFREDRQNLHEIRHSVHPCRPPFVRRLLPGVAVRLSGTR